MEKLPLVLWSGGLDSTYIVWSHLSNNQSVDVVYVDVNNNRKPKGEREKRARDNMKQIFAEEFKEKGRIRKDYNFYIPEFNRDHFKENKLVQSFMWSYALQAVYNSSLHSRVETGYVKGDDFWHIKSGFVDSVKLVSETFFQRESPIVLEFPLEWKPKKEMYETYLGDSVGQKLLNEITWCEGINRVDGKWTQNCSCVPCTKMRSVKRDYEEHRRLTDVSC